MNIRDEILVVAKTLAIVTGIAACVVICVKYPDFALPGLFGCMVTGFIYFMVRDIHQRNSRNKRKMDR